MKNYKYVPKSKYKPIKIELIKLINMVQDDVRELFTFDYIFIGSSSRNMITCDYSNNTGFDFDINIEVNDDEEYTPKQIKEILMKSFNKMIRKYYSGYCECQNNKRVFTLRVYNNPSPNLRSNKVRYGCDFAIVHNFMEKGKEKQEYIKFNKNDSSYKWELQGKGYMLNSKEEFIKEHKLVNELRSIYLDKKNNNTNEYKKSRSLYAEAINELYNDYKNNRF